MPYIAGDVANIDLAVPNITTVDAGRTFWDKVIIIHGLRRWFERRGVLRAGGQRVSRHYYDMHRLVHSDVGIQAFADKALAVDCSRHARMFFNSADLDLATAVPGTFALLPTPQMLSELQQDYDAMAGMIFGEIPSFKSIIDSVTEFEARANAQ
jgi:hypothetical protein